MPGESFWTSGCDLGHEGNFYWEVTGRAVGPFANWAPEEPSGDSGEHCLDLWSGANHLWNDAPCDDQLLYICESHPCE